MSAVTTRVTSFTYLWLLAIETYMPHLTAIVTSLLGYRPGRIFIGQGTVRMTWTTRSCGGSGGIGGFDGIVAFLRLKG